MAVVPYTRFVEICEQRKRVRRQLDVYVVEGPEGQCRKLSEDAGGHESARDPDCGTNRQGDVAPGEDDPDVI